MNLDLMRVAVAGNKGSRGRLIAIATGVAIGVAILLILWGASGGLRARDERNAWTMVWDTPALVNADGASEPLSPETIKVEQTWDYFHDHRILRVDVAALPGSTVSFPGGITPPRAGEYYASPALAQLIDETPADQLGDRYGVRAGLLPDDTLVGPESLVILTGHDPGEGNGSQYLRTLEGFPTSGRGDNATYQVLMVIGGIAVFFPVVLFISIVTQLGAAQRQESFATLRLIGASPTSVVEIASMEMAVTSLVGAIAGVGLAWLIRPLAAMVPINGERSFTSDFAISPLVSLLVVVAMVAVSTIAAGWRIASAGIGPLGGSRQLREERPSWLRAVPLVAGLGAMYLAITSAESGLLSWGVINFLLIIGFAAVCFGIVIIGPWLTYQGARLVSRFAGTAESVIASSRILATPAATFRSVGGLVVAVFLVSVFAGSASVVTQAVSPREGPGQLPLDALSVNSDSVDDLEGMIAALKEVDGVTTVVDGRLIDHASPPGGNYYAMTTDDARALGYETVPDSEWVAYDHYELTASEVESVPEVVPVDAGDIGDRGYLYIRTDGSAGARERARTVVEQGGVEARVPMTRVDMADLGTTRLVNSLAVLAYLGIFFSVTIAGISLAVSTVAAMLDRKRVLGLMRLMGMPAGSVRQIIGLEAAVPLITVLGGSVALGFLVAWMIIGGLGQGEFEMGWPDPRYFLTLAVSLLLAVLAIVAGSATVNRNTSVSATRFE
jgi:hypothetical protein